VRVARSVVVVVVFALGNGRRGHPPSTGETHAVSVQEREGKVKTFVVVDSSSSSYVVATIRNTARQRGDSPSTGQADAVSAGTEEEREAAFSNGAEK